MIVLNSCWRCLPLTAEKHVAIIVGELGFPGARLLVLSGGSINGQLGLCPSGPL